MSNVLVRIVLVISLFFTESPAKQINLPPIPCPDVFKYEFDGNKYAGIITLGGLTFGETDIQVRMEYPESNKDQVSSGELLLDSKNDEIFDQIRSGRPIVFRADIPYHNTVPQIIDITVNGSKICLTSNENSLEFSRLPRSMLTFKHALIVNRNSTEKPQLSIEPDLTRITKIESQERFDKSVQNHFQRNAINDIQTKHKLYQIRLKSALSTLLPPPTQSVRTRRTESDTPSTDSNRTKQENPFVEKKRREAPDLELNIDNHCGRENEFEITGLVANGEPTSTSRFPWLVAIYKLTSTESIYQCGGSLISHQTVISAAHCFKVGSRFLRELNILMSLGVHNRSHEPYDAIHCGVDKLIIHQDYGRKIDADIAIVILNRRMIFSLIIRPICLWQGSESVADIEGAVGSVAGWGESVPRNGSSQVPKVVNMTIVSELECVRSNYQLYYLTSNRTLCAGNKDGSGPCYGDSGSGLMMLIGKRWMLRALVSTALSTSGHECDLEKYVIFSDVAKFSGWIKENMVL